MSVVTCVGESDGEEEVWVAGVEGLICILELMGRIRQSSGDNDIFTIRIIDVS